MKISFRILSINFAIVAVILISSALAFYSITYSVLSSQQSKYLSNSRNNFSEAYRKITENIDDDFITFFKGNKDVSNNSYSKISKLDFIIEVDRSNSSEIASIKFIKKSVTLPQGDFTLEEFIKLNPAVILNSYRSVDKKIYYYGKIIDENTLNEISNEINADLALVWQDTPLVVSNSQNNQDYIYNLSQAVNTFNTKNNFEINSQETDNNYILSTLYTPTSFNLNTQLKFLIFSGLNEVSDLRSRVKLFLIVIGAAGILLSLILTLVFTDKIRKQIGLLSRATVFTSDLNFKNKIDIKTNDEIGQLASAFNSMLDVLSKNQRVKNEYAEFVALLNQNPSLKEISDAALRKIIKTHNFTAGAMYSADNNKTSLISSYGFDSHYKIKENSAYFDLALKDKKQIEFNLENNPIEINAGIMNIKIKYLLIIPVIYNNETIAVVELCSTEKPSNEAKEFLSNIQEQLSIGLMNAKTFVRMGDLVSELKKLNESYQTQNKALVELHNQLKEKAEELRQQKERAEESTKVKSQFLASMSHELRTPMNSILGLTELMLSDTSSPGKNQERLEIVLKSGKRLMNLINDILDLSKIEAGKMQVTLEDTALEDLLREIEDSIKPMADNKGLQFKIIRHSNSNLIIKTDRNKVTQVLLNLLSNAVKFTEKGKVELHVTNINNEKLKFDVCDTGIGISEDNQTAVFEEFRQVDGTTSRKYSGTGLGLSISQRIVTLLEGKLTVQSELNKGSIFSFVIPVRTLHDESDPENYNYETYENAAEIIGDENNEANKVKNKILIVDDDPDILFTLKEMVQSLGFTPEIANGGKECLSMLEKEIPGLILLDIMMPEMDGFQTIKHIRENKKYMSIPVFAVSAKAMSSERNIIIKHGFDDFIPKPIDAKILGYKLKKIIHIDEVKA
jgi:two-component system, chemotaxis family, sensor kinase CheA